MRIPLSTRRRLLAGATTTLLLPAVVQAQGTGRDGNPQDPGKEKVAAALPRLRQLAREIADRKMVPGLSIAVVHGDEVVFLEGFGVRQIDRPEPVDPDTVFQLASRSKPLAATIVAGLVGDGKVSWDTRIRDIDPGRYHLLRGSPRRAVRPAERGRLRSTLGLRAPDRAPARAPGVAIPPSVVQDRGTGSAGVWAAA